VTRYSNIISISHVYLVPCVYCCMSIPVHYRTVPMSFLDPLHPQDVTPNCKGKLGQYPRSHLLQAR